jgi:brefeldin A-resistance guanine nucleotide exchange factor 1
MFLAHLAPLAWRKYQLPVLSSLSRQCTNSSREVRNAAMSYLPRVLRTQPAETIPAIVSDIFNRVVFPLLDELLRPQVFQRDPAGMPATRAAAAALLANTFLQLETRPGTRSVDVRVLWIQILDLFDRLMNIDRRDQLVRRAQA